MEQKDRDEAGGPGVREPVYRTLAQAVVDVAEPHERDERDQRGDEGGERREQAGVGAAVAAVGRGEERRAGERKAEDGGGEVGEGPTALGRYEPVLTGSALVGGCSGTHGRLPLGAAYGWRSRARAT